MIGFLQLGPMIVVVSHFSLYPSITNLVSVAILNLFKDSLTLIGLLGVMFFQNWRLSLIAIIMIPLASYAARTLGKRIGKVSKEQMERVGFLHTYLMELFKNHKIIKIFQQENYEKVRADKALEAVKVKSKKINEVIVRTSPIMEFFYRYNDRNFDFLFWEVNN